MKLTRNGTAMAILGSLLFGGCANEAPWGSEGDRAGKISLNLATNGSVSKSTRADDEVSPVIPGVHEFGISLNSSDGSYSKTWSSPEQFNREDGFPMGHYTIAATFGDIESEGFSSPCFKGESDVDVRLGEETSSTITATLANSMVSVRYTDKFRMMFPQFQAHFKSEGHTSAVTVVKEETRPLYMSPRQITFSLSLTNQQGKEQTVTPAVFNASPKTHYVVVVDVTEETGVATLDVAFEENVVSETTEILLTDELFTAPLPSIDRNADAQETLNAFENIPIAAKNPELHLIAFGGIQKATLSVEASNGGVAPFTSVELIKAGSEAQAIVSAAGFECSGFFKNVDRMAVVNMKNFTKSLVPGNYKVSLDVTDGLGRSINPEDIPVVEFTVSPVVVKIEESSVNPAFLDNKVEVLVSSNCPNVSEGISLSVDGSVAKILSQSNIESASEEYPYVNKVMLQKSGSITDAACLVEGTLANKMVGSVEMDVKFPEITIDADAFSNRALFRVDCGDAAVKKYVIEKGVVRVGTADLSGTVSRDASTSIITKTSLAPSTTFSTYGLAVGDKSRGDKYVKVIPVPEFTTEAETKIPNGDFSQKRSGVFIKDIQVGSQFKNSAFKPYYTIKSSIDTQEPDGWCSINEKTAYKGSSNLNTWYVEPSTLYINDELQVRSVGYSHNGKDLGQSGGNMNMDYYGKNTPNLSDLQIIPGELFLGEYSFNGSERRIDGIDFYSRPSYFTFNYKYSSMNNEEGEAIVRLFGDNNELLFESVSYLKHTLNPVEVKIPCKYQFGKKAKRLEVGFKSVKSDVIPSVYIPTGGELKEEGSGWSRTIPANSYHALAVGSTLTLYNVKLGYE